MFILEIVAKQKHWTVLPVNDDSNQRLQSLYSLLVLRNASSCGVEEIIRRGDLKTQWLYCCWLTAQCSTCQSQFVVHTLLFMKIQPSSAGKVPKIFVCGHMI